jgi:hypothetical protein
MICAHLLLFTFGPPSLARTMTTRLLSCIQSWRDYSLSSSGPPTPLSFHCDLNITRLPFLVACRSESISDLLKSCAGRLASAPEGSLARQLFYPLLMSTVHWLTKNASREAAETVALLDALLLGVADDSSAAKRFLPTTSTLTVALDSTLHLCIICFP